MAGLDPTGNGATLPDLEINTRLNYSSVMLASPPGGGENCHAEWSDLSQSAGSIGSVQTGKDVI